MRERTTGRAPGPALIEVASAPEADAAPTGVPTTTAATGRGGYRVLMIAPTSFFADYGCHVRILEEARVLGRLGCTVTICTYHNGRTPEGVDVRRTVSIPWRAGYEVGSSRHKIAFDALLFLRTLGCLASVRPHVIHAHLHEGALIGLVLSRLWGVPLVFDYQGSMTSEMVDHRFLAPLGRPYRALRRLEGWIDRHAPRIITSSTNARQQLVTDFSCCSERILPIPDCVDTDAFAPLAEAERLRIRRAWGIPEGRTLVVYLGKLAEYQGTDHLLRAAARVLGQRRDVHFCIAGYPFVERYQALAEELGIAEHCTFTGRIDYQREAPGLLAMGDVAVSPKMSATEGAGKILNYMACGLPTVAFESPVSREFLGALGVYAPRGDADALAERLLELIAAPERRVALGLALRERARECFSWDAAGRAIMGLYAELRGERG